MEILKHDSIDVSQREAEFRQKLLDLLRANPTIKPVGDETLQALAERAEFWICRSGSTILEKGDAGHEFFLILSGQVRVINTDEDPAVLLAYLHQNEFFGEKSLLGDRIRAATIDVVVDTNLAVFDEMTWHWLTTKHPDLIAKFANLESFYENRSGLEFPGRQIDEIVIRKDNRHILALVARLSGPLFMVIIALATGILLTELGVAGGTVGIVTGILTAFSILWIAYGYLDWVNDDFIVTSDRVIHIERTIIYGETRQEAPLTAIQDVSVNIPNIFTRFFGYYDVIIKTAGAGNIVFDGLREGNEIKSDIFEHRAKAQERVEASDTSAIRKSLISRMQWEVGPVEAPELVAVGERPIDKPFKLPRPIDMLIPKVREQDGDRIRWRKHYFILLQKIALPLLAIFVGIYLTIALLFGLAPFRFVTVNFGLTITFIVGWAVLIFWYAYQYDTWNKDIYIVTTSSIIDLKGSPLGLGPETKREGTFDVIQNTTYETPSFFTRILNMGNVVIESAGTENTFTFEQVYNYRAVQQEISKRLIAFQEADRKKNRAVEERRYTRWLGEYHDLQKQTGEIELPSHIKPEKPRS